MENLLKVTALYVVFFYLLYKLYRVNRRNNKRIGAYSGIVFAFILYYCVVPLIINSVDIKENNKYVQSIIDASGGRYVFAVVSIIVFILVFSYVYRRYNKRTSEIKYEFQEKKWRKISKIFSWITYVVGGGAFCIYIVAFGGIGNLLKNAEYLRSFATSGTSLVSYYASIMVVPARLITVTPILSLTLCSKKEKNWLVYRIMFVTSLIMMGLFVLSNAGRTSIILMILMFLIPFMGKFVKHPWRIAIILGSFALPFLGILDALFLFFAGKGWNYNTVNAISYISQFSHPFSNVLNAGEIVKISGLRWGQDFVTGFLNLVPGVNFSVSYEPTSFFYGGANWNITGGTPNDILTFSYLEFGIVGIILVAILTGIIVGKMDRLLKQFNLTYSFRVVATSVIINMFAYVINADIVSLVRNQFQLTIVCICVLYSCKRVVARK